MLLCTVLSVLLLTVLYRIKLNHNKFTYGIYLSFGADFKRLLTSAFSEMLVITAITALPSAFLTYLLGFLLYIPAGGLSGFYILPILLLIVGLRRVGSPFCDIAGAGAFQGRSRKAAAGGG